MQIQEMKSAISEKNLTDGLNYQMDMLNERIINFKLDQPKLLKLMPHQNLFPFPLQCLPIVTLHMMSRF